MKLSRIISIIAAGLLVASCSGKQQTAQDDTAQDSTATTTAAATPGDKTVKYLPYQESADGKWGLVSLTGEVLVAPQYKYTPTIPVEGLYWVIDDEGMWTLHRAEKDGPQVSADRWQHATAFYGGRAIVKAKDKAPCIIDAQGKVVKDLATIDGASVEEVRALHEGLAVFTTTDGHKGAIDNDGNVVIPARYYELSDAKHGMLLAVDYKYKDGFTIDNHGEFNDYEEQILDTKGQALNTIDHHKYNTVEILAPDRLVLSKPQEGDSDLYAIVDVKGNNITDYCLDISDYSEMQGDYYIGSSIFFPNQGLFHVKDGFTGGDDYLWTTIAFAGPKDMLLVSWEPEGEEYLMYRFVDFNDKPINDLTWRQASTFKEVDGKHAIVRDEHDTPFKVINTDFKPVAGMPTLHNIGVFYGEAACNNEPYHGLDYLLLMGLVVNGDNQIIELGFPQEPQSEPAS